MIEKLTLGVEKRAQEAERYSPFDGISLLRIKRALEELLALIGRGGIFDEYTKHDISHVDAMIKSLDWLVPAATAKLMTPADWMLIVLAIYLHDLGMLVTTTEYAQRDSSGFPAYRDQQLFGGDRGIDYKAKIEELPPDAAQRFLYQEFVRERHPQRVRDWIEGRASTHLGVSHEAITIVGDLLSGLDESFRQDLALVCESHHADDLREFGKYPVSRPYGNTDAEAANVHYAALLLRAADLLHITRDRTPSVLFRAVDPVDPVSQHEWGKQRAVRAVRPKMGVDVEGNPDKAAPRDTIEIHALFTDPSGFFGLTAYLTYVADELVRCHEWADLAQKTHASEYSFPWRRIDDTQITTKGFLRDKFEFTIEQPRILDLLTGHTLYNDTSVVLRELAQNALDAVRLQHHIDLQTNPQASPGKVTIHWDSQARVLSVEDQGTGMTQGTIGRHLLKVAASLYQDDEFKRQYPDFCPISRFGIGILATFMVADEVEILTVHPDEEQARQLSLRSVHGRYLIRLLDKETDAAARRLAPHGTLVRVKVRPSAEIPNVIESAKRWIVIPGCVVTAAVDDSQPVPIGFAFLKDALRAELESHGIRVEEAEAGGERIQTVERQSGGVTLACAMRWSEYFREWSFLVPPARRRPDERVLLGTCVEGMRVEGDSPGFDGFPVWAIANSTGPASPRTNVARSGIEANPARAAMLREIYTMYCAHVRDEVQALHRERCFSLSWSATEGRYLVSPLLPEEQRRNERTFEVIDARLLLDAVSELPLFVVEQQGERSVASAAAIADLPEFWTVHSRSTESAEVMIQEAPGRASLTALMALLSGGDAHLPPGPLLCAVKKGRLLDELALSRREVASIDVDTTRRRVDLLWQRTSDPPRWVGLPNAPPDVASSPWFRPWFPAFAANFMLATDAVQVSGLTGEIGVRVSGITFFVANTPLWNYLSPLARSAEHDPEELVWFETVTSIVEAFVHQRWKPPLVEEEFASLVHRIIGDSFPASRVLERVEREGRVEELLSVLNAGPPSVFDVGAWSRA
jgi:hypothetical protein